MAFNYKFKIHNVIFIVHWSLKVDNFIDIRCLYIYIYIYIYILLEELGFIVGVTKKKKNLKITFTNKIYMKQI
jgi:hypothetical protein